MADDFEKELINTFFQESDINLEEAEEVYLQFSENTPLDLLSRSFRLAHNLKGSAKAVGFLEVSEILHNLESLLLKLKNKEISVNNELVNLLLKANDKVKLIISELKNNNQYTSDYKILVSEIKDFIENRNSNQGVEQETGQNTEQEKQIVIEENPPIKEEFGFFGSDVPKKEEHPIIVSNNNINKVKKKENKKPENVDDVIRVSISRIERLQNNIGEIVIIESMIEEQINNKDFNELKNTYRLLYKITKEVQDIIMSLRLVSIKPVFQKLTRTAHDTSLFLNKKIDLKFNGEDTEIDKFILDEIADPLMHMIRNSIDHGIENEEIRISKNKATVGTINVTASHESGDLVLVVQDDGAGMNPQTIYESAVKKRLIKGTEKLTDEECYKLIFAPGFSTKAETTEISGRGVGMDVVKTTIDELNGKIEIKSKINEGTKFKIRIPLTIGIMDAFITEISNKKYVIPLNQVVECMSLSKCKIKYISNIDSIIILRNEEIPIFDLSEGFGNIKKENNSIKNTDKSVFIIKSNDKKIAAVVDKIIAIQSIVTKSLGEELRCEKGIVGSVILGDGKAAPILEIGDLVLSHSFQKNFQRSKNRIEL
ncbi:chemotaxis protein CheA [Spirobacillus cienkowskii]|uniref:chemotaxis protein CheA n=1 Tax=Spirobacillus cienkowskii TaxID=495820 RepID=UPI0030D3A8A2